MYLGILLPCPNDCHSSQTKISEWNTHLFTFNYINVLADNGTLVTNLG